MKFLADYVITRTACKEKKGLATLRAATCAYAPRGKRFRRVSRLAQRLMHAPIALTAIVEVLTESNPNERTLRLGSITKISILT